MKVILNYDQVTGQITDNSGMMITTWVGLNYEEVKEASNGQMDGEQLIRIMKIAAHISEPENIKDI